MPVIYNKEANGGTEILSRFLEENLDKSLLDQFDIISGRVPEGFQKTKPLIYWSHDLPGDPMSDFINKDSRFVDHYVFVSDWQQQAFVNSYFPKIENNCVSTIPNFVKNYNQEFRKNNKRKRLVYYSTPHRGLTLLFAAVSQMVQETPDLDLSLDVFSSYDIYNQANRNDSFKAVFDACKEAPWINYSGSIPHVEMLRKLPNYDILAYPSIWMETSCLCLAESMAAGLICVHPNLAALPETSGGLTQMYQFVNDPNEHVQRFKIELRKAMTEDVSMSRLRAQQTLIKETRSPDQFLKRWESLLINFKPRKKDVFVVQAG